MGNVTRSLAQIERGLGRLQRQVVLDALRSGVSDVHTRSVLGSCGLASVSDVEELYAWRDGTDTSLGKPLDDLHFFPGFYLLSVEDAAANHQAFVIDPRWTQGWLPVFANGGGDFYVVDLGDRGGSVRHFRIDEAEHPVEFLSLAAMLQTIDAAFERGVFYVPTDDYLEMDDLEFGSLAAELNPQVAWRDE
jgi:hypothetical protein